MQETVILPLDNNDIMNCGMMQKKKKRTAYLMKAFMIYWNHHKQQNVPVLQWR